MKLTTPLIASNTLSITSSLPLYLNTVNVCLIMQLFPIQIFFNMIYYTGDGYEKVLIIFNILGDIPEFSMVSECFLFICRLV